MLAFRPSPLSRLIIVLALLGWGLSAFAQPSPGPLAVRFLDVGQADAVLVRCPEGEHFLLIDAGDNRYPGSAAAFRAQMEEVFSGKPEPWQLALVVASHPHADHIGSMKWVLKNFDVVTYLDNGQNYDSATWAKLDKLRRKQVEEGELNYVNGKEARSGELEFCPLVRVEFLVPWAFHSLSDTNDRSVIVRVSYEDTSFLFVGDAEDHAEEVMLNELEDDQRALLDVDVLKVGHHGSDTSSTAEFVLHVSPAIAVVSSGHKGVGTNVRYKHPRFSTLRTYRDWFKSLDSDEHRSDGRVWAFDREEQRWRQHVRRRGVWVTPKDGTVIVRSDGESLEIQPEIRTNP